MVFLISIVVDRCGKRREKAQAAGSVDIDIGRKAALLDAFTIDPAGDRKKQQPARVVGANSNFVAG